MSTYFDQVLASAKSQAELRDNQIETTGFDVSILTNPKANDLTEFGEVSYYTERTERVIKFLTDLETWYSMLPFDGQGRVDEGDSKKEYLGYVKTTEPITQGDIINLTYSYFDNTIEPKYYQVKKVLVSSAPIPIAKKLVLASYALPVKIQETTNPRSDYISSQPTFNGSSEELDF